VFWIFVPPSFQQQQDRRTHPAQHHCVRAMAVFELPPELLVLVMQHMPAKMLGRAVCVCTSWRAEEKRSGHTLWTALWMQLKTRSTLVAHLPAKQRFRVQTMELSKLPLRLRNMSDTPIIQRVMGHARLHSDPVEACHRKLCHDIRFDIEIHGYGAEPIASASADVQHPDFTSIHPGAVEFAAHNFFASMPDCFCSHEAMTEEEDRMDWRPTGTVQISVWARRPDFYDSRLRLLSFPFRFDGFHDCSARGTELEDNDDTLHDESWFYATNEGGLSTVFTRWSDRSAGMIGPRERVNGLKVGVSMCALRERNAGNWNRRKEETASWTLTGMNLFLEWNAGCNLPQGKTAPTILQLDDLLCDESAPWKKAIDPVHQDLLPEVEHPEDCIGWNDQYRCILRAVLGDEMFGGCDVSGAWLPGPVEVNW